MGDDNGISQGVSGDRVRDKSGPCDGILNRERCICDPPASRWVLSRTRRMGEVGFALVVLILGAVPMALLAVAIRLTSEGPALFCQQRLGAHGNLFTIYKFRSMREVGPANRGAPHTSATDGRLTLVGRFMRKFKLDELPQLYNVLRGDMSIVGPRPTYPKCTGLQNMPYRPGLTGAATIAFRNEEQMLLGVVPEALDEFYGRNIKPVKARLDVCYMCRATPISDLRLMISTITSCLFGGGEAVEPPMAGAGCRAAQGENASAE